jgi:hypothetical protein
MFRRGITVAELAQSVQQCRPLTVVCCDVRDAAATTVRLIASITERRTLRRIT